MSVVSRTSDAAGTRRREAELAFLNATEALLEAGESFADLPIERIALEAGRTRTAFYLYFADKSELLRRLAEAVAEELYQQAQAWWDEDTGRRGLSDALESIMGTWRNHAALLRAVVGIAGVDEELGSFWRSLVGRFVEATERRLIEEGLSPRAAAGRAFALVWMTERVCYLHAGRQSNLTDDQALEELVEIWERGVYG